MTNIEDLVVKGAGQKFQGKDFRQLLTPGVYLFMGRGRVLYVGMSDRLLRRIGTRHEQASKAIEECSQVFIYPCVNVKAAKQLEAALIGNLKPKYNKYYRMHAKAVLGVVTTKRFEQ